MLNRNDSHRGCKRNNAPLQRVPQLINIFGPKALFLAWPDRSKGAKQKWGHLTIAEMIRPSYLRKLDTTGNIGLALGAVSDRLCAIDLDREDLRVSFLEANSWAAHTTEVRGARGCKFFVKLEGDYPPTAHFRRNEEDVAQWLADKAQAIVSGTHPTGTAYCFVTRVPPVRIKYSHITWPESLSLPPSHQHFTEQQSNRATEATELRSRRADEAFEAVAERLVSRFVPTTIHQNNYSLFQIARGLKDLDNQLGKSLTQDDRRVVFDLWAKHACHHWRPEQTYDEYWLEFLDACNRAAFGLQEDPVPAAWEAAQRRTSVREADTFEDPRLKLLVTFCAEMQRSSVDRPFFIPTRRLETMFGVSHTKAAMWLRGLCHLKILRRTETGSKTRCPRYVYLPLRSGSVSSPVLSESDVRERLVCGEPNNDSRITQSRNGLTD